MGIMTRFLRLCKADIHGVMDQVEDQGLLLRQHLRDMEEELDRKDAAFRNLEACREQARADHDRHVQECGKLEEDLALAILKGKDDIARMLIRKLKTLQTHRENLMAHMEAMERDLARSRDSLDEQRLLYKQLQLKATQFFRRQERLHWEEAMAAASSSAAYSEPSDGEVELELLRRKEARGGRASS